MCLEYMKHLQFFLFHRLTQAEGPKKIEEIHRDAAFERNRTQQLDRQQSARMRDGPRGAGPA
jgi:hypothetical protein